MRIRFALPALVAAVAATALVLPSGGTSTADAASASFKVDDVHSFVMFRMAHMPGVGAVYGRFNDFSGTITFDPENVGASSVAIEVQAASVDTGPAARVGGRDKHITGPDFLNAAQFPTVTFKSTKVTKVDDTHLDVAGDFTLHGVTKPVTVRLTQGGPVDDPRAKVPRISFEGTFTIQRGDFGITKYLDPRTDEVAITVAIEALKQ